MCHCSNIVLMYLCDVHVLESLCNCVILARITGTVFHEAPELQTLPQFLILSRYGLQIGQFWMYCGVMRGGGGCIGLHATSPGTLPLLKILDLPLEIMVVQFYYNVYSA